MDQASCVRRVLFAATVGLATLVASATTVIAAPAQERDPTRARAVDADPAMDKAWSLASRGEGDAGVAVLDAEIAALATATGAEPGGDVGRERRRLRVLSENGAMLSFLARDAEAAAVYADLARRDPLVVAHRFNLGEARLILGDSDGARAALHEALDLATRLGADDDRRRIQIDLGDIAADRGDWATARVAYEAAQAIAERALADEPDNDDNRYSLLQAHARVLDCVEAGDDTALGDRLRDALLVEAQDLVDRRPDLTLARGALAGAWQRLAARAEALDDYATAVYRHEKAVDVRRLLVKWRPAAAEERRRLAIVLNALSQARVSLSDLQGAIADGRAAVEAARAAADRTRGAARFTETLMDAEATLADALWSVGEHASALPHQEVARDLALQLLSLGPDRAARRSTAIRMQTLVAELQMDAGNDDAAFATLALARDLIAGAEPGEATEARRQRLMARIERRTARVLLRTGKPIPARAAAEAARRIATALREVAPDDVNLAQDLADIQILCGDAAVALRDQTAATADYRAAIATADAAALRAKLGAVARLQMRTRNRLVDVLQDADAAAALSVAAEAAVFAGVAFAANPNSDPALQELAYAQRRLGDVHLAQDAPKAVAAMRAAAAYRQAVASYTAWADRAWTLERSGEVVIAAEAEAGALEDAGNAAAAVLLLEDVLERLSREAASQSGVAEWHRQMSDLNRRIGRIWWSTSQSAAALDAYRSAIMDREDVVATPEATLDDHEALLLMYRAVAEIYGAADDWSQGRAAREWALAATRAWATRAPPEQQPRLEMAFSLITLSDAIRADGLYAVAASRARDGLALIDPVDSASANTRAGSLTVFGNEALGRALLQEGGADEEAVAALKRALEVADWRAAAKPDDAQRQFRVMVLHRRLAEATNASSHLWAAVKIAVQLQAQGKFDDNVRSALAKLAAEFDQLHQRRAGITPVPGAPAPLLRPLVTPPSPQPSGSP